MRANKTCSILADAFSTENESGPSNADLEALVLERTWQLSDDGRKLATSLGLKVEVRGERNDSSIWQTILNAADVVEAELIVIGTRGVWARTES
jgi:nucleotide-binding universal stress UspA family protein